MWSGVLKFSARTEPEKNKSLNENSSTSVVKEAMLPEGWVKYTSGEFGYSVAYPDGWNAREENTGKRDLLIMAPKSAAFVRISAFKDESLDSEEAVKASMVEYKASFTEKPDEQVKEFKTETKDGLGYFGVSGFMLVSGVSYQFLEKGILSPNGRALIMRGAVDTREESMTEAEFQGFVKIVKQIIDSFTIL